jgi:hypothetical protein
MLYTVGLASVSSAEITRSMVKTWMERQLPGCFETTIFLAMSTDAAFDVAGYARVRSSQLMYRSTGKGLAGKVEP